MIIWKTEKLAELLVNNRLSESEKVLYYLASLYLHIITAAVPSYFWGTKIDELGLVSFVLGAVVATYSINKIFLINKTIGGKNIIERLAVLSFPAFLKATILYWVLYFAFLLLYVITDNTITLQIFGFLIIPFFYWFGFELIGMALKKQCITG